MAEIKTSKPHLMSRGDTMGKLWDPLQKDTTPTATSAIGRNAEHRLVNYVLNGFFPRAGQNAILLDLTGLPVIESYWCL